MRHLGNAVGHEPDHPEVLDSRGTLNLLDLTKKFDPRHYLPDAHDGLVIPGCAGVELLRDTKPEALAGIGG